MSFLGGVNLGTPADRQRQALTRELELRRDRWPVRRGDIYRGGADLCLRHGKFRPGRALPDAYTQVWQLNGITCYLDALAAAEADPSLRYCEGYASTGSGIFISHAWCIAPDDGVLEVRYPRGGGWRAESNPNMPVLPPEHWGYWGVTFHTELAGAYQQQYGLGFLDRSEREVADMRAKGFDEAQVTGGQTEYPILKAPYDPDRTAL